MKKNRNKILNYGIIEELPETILFYRFKIFDENLNQYLIINEFKLKSISPATIAKIKLEYDNRSKINIDGILKIYNILEYDNKIAILSEYFECTTLKEYIYNSKLILNKSIEIVLKISKILGFLHKEKIINDNVNPSNILINEKTNEIKLIGFGISTEVTNESLELNNYEVIKDILVYISPEQTGRMNRKIDYRTDIYSLGIVMYELFTGIVPYISNDPLEVIHHHIAIEAINPQKNNQSIPNVISNIILKALSKMPEERYQNCFSLMRDLEQCSEQLDHRDYIKEFEIAKNDISPMFIMPQRIIGREKELKILSKSVMNVCEYGNTDEVIIVSGPPGIGKSALIHEMQKSITSNKGYFISGKFDQFRQDVPYSAIIQAFRALVNKILTETEEEIAKWKNKINNILYPNGRIITDVIPELELIIGEQPELQQLDPEKNLNRFNYVIGKFASIVASKEHPVIIFFDDVQWVDSASLNLFNLIIEQNMIEYFLLIGSYRDNEVTKSHPLSITLDKWEEDGIIINRISLGMLNPDNVNEMISHFLRCDPIKANLLSMLVHKKTNGNPFFVNQFIKTLYDKKLLRLDINEGWQWNLNEIKAMKITDNVVELMSDKIISLPNNIQRVLKICACIGNNFDLETVSLFENESIDVTLKSLQFLIEEGYLTQQDFQYNFQHDRIQEAAYSLVSKTEKAKLHYNIGNLMLKMTDEENLKDNILYIVEQLNAGRSLIESEKEIYRLSELNLWAGKKAKSSTAYKAAKKHFTIGIDIIKSLESNPSEKVKNDFCWSRFYDLTLSLYTELAESAYLNFDYKDMETYCKIVLEFSKTLVEKVEIYVIYMRAYLSQNKLLKAADIGLNALTYFDVSLQKEPNKIDILKSMIKTRLLLKGKNILDLPIMDNKEMLGAIRLLTSVAVAVAWAKPKLVPLNVLKAMQILLKYGNCDKSPFVYCAYGFILCAIGDIEQGYKFGEQALSLSKKLNIKENQYAVFTLNTYIRHWKEHIKESIKPFKDNFQSSLNIGDYNNAATSTIMLFHHQFAAGIDLRKLEKEISISISIIQKNKSRTQVQILSLYHQIFQNLLDSNCKKPYEFSGDIYNEEKMLPIHFKATDKQAITTYYIFKIILLYMFSKNQEAYDLLETTEKFVVERLAIYSNILFRFYDSLIRLSLYDSSKRIEQKKILLKVTKNQKIIKKWLKHNKVNLSNKYYLVKAEKSRVLNKRSEAVYYYKKSIIFARKYNFIHEEALANECAAKFWLKSNNNEYSTLHLDSAYKCYLTWGAYSKISQLEFKYTQQMNIELTNSLSIDTLDLSTVMKAAQTLSSEIYLDNLLIELMNILFKNAGAQKGVLILRNKVDDNLYIEAEGTINSKISVLKSIPIKNSKNILTSLVNYVYKSKKDLVLNNAYIEGDFIDDDYVLTNKPKSILCANIIQNGKVIGIIYLENNLTSNVFTSERLKLIRLLSAQLAISIENARLYDNLDKTVKERTAQLEEANRALKELSLKDPLTKLRNRRYVYDYISKTTENFIESKIRLLQNSNKRDSHIEKKVYGVYLLDIDHFKNVNDTYGHQAGDTVLVNLSETLNSIVRAEDIVVRWGGEEFLIILMNSEIHYICKFAQKVLSVIKNKRIKITGGRFINITCSIGFSQIPIHASDPDLLSLEQEINICDFALYIAKENGRKQAVSIGLQEIDIDSKAKNYLRNLSKDSNIDNKVLDIRYIY